MRMRDFTICSVSLILAAGLFIAAGSQLDNINAERSRLNLTLEKPQNVPASIAFATAATGAFRGLVIDILWLRAEKMKMEGQFFDAKQLAEWITILQPRFATVWDFQAWNMAYNISVTMPATEPQERWRWVKNGYEMLRDKAIPLNSTNISLYRSIALIFQQKIGGVTDDCHNFYKLQLALEMEPLLGPADNRYFKALASAPQDWEKVAADANMSGLISALSNADGKVFAAKSADEFVGSYLSLRQNPQRFGDKVFEVVNKYRNSSAMDNLDVFARAYQLRNVMKLDPVVMEQLNEAYGPVDWEDPNKHLPLEWRHPETHAIYWAYMGLKNSGRDSFSLDLAGTDRIINHALQNLFRQGKIYIYSAPLPPQPGQEDKGPIEVVQAIYLRPDLRMFKSYNRSIIATLDIYNKINPTTAEAMETGYKNMLKNSFLTFYQTGHRKQAIELYGQLRKYYPSDDLKDSVDSYAREQFRQELVDIGINNIRGIVQGILQEAYFYYAMRDDDQAAINEKLAKEAYDTYYQMRVTPGNVIEQKRIGLPEFNALKYFAIVDFFNDYQYPDILKENLLRRIEIERPELYQEILKQRKIAEGEAAPEQVK